MVVAILFAVAGYWYGAKIHPLPQATPAVQPPQAAPPIADTRYRDLFLVDPLAYETRLLISQEVTGTLAGVTDTMITVETDAGTLSLVVDDTFAFHQCADAASFSNCVRATGQLRDVKGMPVKITAFRRGSAYYVGYLRYV
ncbi:MAG: hypothetical protein HYY37_00220 [Candidatus Aenigmarchaeota archaeon]|nr:hypothetical protein [Candidatus Aenigmarchaeota archaeon]